MDNGNGNGNEYTTRINYQKHKEQRLSPPPVKLFIRNLLALIKHFQTFGQLLDLPPQGRADLPDPDYPLAARLCKICWDMKIQKSIIKLSVFSSFDVVTNGAIPCGWASVTREARLSGRLSYPGHPINHHQYLSQRHLFLLNLFNASFFDDCVLLASYSSALIN